MMNNLKKVKKPLTIDQKIKRRNFISLSVFALSSAAAYKGWRILYTSPEEATGITGGAQVPLRRALNKTELFFRNFFSNNHLVKTYPKAMAAKNVRQNSNIGLESNIDIAGWKMEVKKSGGEVVHITIDQIKALPKTEIVYDFKCVEGWDQIQYWGGLKMIDFIEYFGLAEEIKMQYMGLITPDGEYQVGLDMPSAIHPQTILAYEMNGRPIPHNHGAPLRLIIPVKYGIKNLKRIGSMTFSNTRPPDYWAREGYDYYSGL
ncbi:molybdopterin-dependent oxidoreductase [Mucilaginibacter terrae]|uniref:molybdopterin-dependent oxidoreductase n=1 Tax=Mucilaginibacter terrae TaxID=1955052 RepID=UPI00363F18FF